MAALSFSWELPDDRKRVYKAMARMGLTSPLNCRLLTSSSCWL